MNHQTEFCDRCQRTFRAAVKYCARHHRMECAGCREDERAEEGMEANG